MEQNEQQQPERWSADTISQHFFSVSLIQQVGKEPRKELLDDLRKQVALYGGLEALEQAIEEAGSSPIKNMKLNLDWLEESKEDK